jgi:hypothetical protein
MARRAAAHRVGIATARADVVEDPLVVADLFLDVFLDGAARPARAASRPAPQARMSGTVWLTW